MSDQLDWVLIPFDKKCERTNFDCGYKSLNSYIRELASQDIKRGLSRIYLAVPKANQQKIYGYYAISAGQISYQTLPEQIRRKLPQYPIPVVRIGRLAVDKSVQAQGVGDSLLTHALSRALEVSAIMGVRFVVVDAEDQKAGGFYERYGFIPFSDDPLKLFISLDTVRRALIAG